MSPRSLSRVIKVTCKYCCQIYVVEEKEQYMSETDLSY